MKKYLLELVIFHFTSGLYILIFSFVTLFLQNAMCHPGKLRSFCVLNVFLHENVCSEYSLEVHCEYPKTTFS